MPDERLPFTATHLSSPYDGIRPLPVRVLLDNVRSLADAIREAAPTDGLQVHRSHWVARRHIAALRREKGRIILTLSNGRDIPVSRTYEQAVAQAGGTPDI